MRQLFTVLGILFAFLAVGARAASSESPAGASDDLPPIVIRVPRTLEYVERARDLVSQGLFEQGIAEFNEAIRIDPESAPLHGLRANAHFLNKQWQESRADFERALALEPGQPIAMGGLGVLEMQLGNTGEAISLLRSALEKLDENTLRRVLINAYVKVDDHDNALAEMEKYSQRAPAEIGMYALRIQTLVKAGRIAEIGAVAHEIVKSKDSSSEGYLAASLYCYLAGQNDWATAIADEGISRAPSADLYFQRSLAEKDPSRQRSDLQLALRLSPKHVLALARLADVNLKLKDYPAATLALNQMEGLQGFSPPADFYRMRGDALSGLRDKAGATRAYASARSKVKDAKELNNMCWAKATNKAAAKGLLQEALKDCDAALALLPECWNCHDSRGLVLLRLKRFKEAASSYETAVSGNSAEAMSLYGRGIAKLHARRKAEGKEDIAAAIALSPTVADQFRKYGIDR